MIIKGRKNDIYEVQWTPHGRIYTRVHVYKHQDIKFLGRTWGKYWKWLWSSFGKRPVTEYDADRMTPSQIVQWFQTVVDEYENHTDAWKGVRKE
jgi:hypothetical protein